MRKPEIHIIGGSIASRFGIEEKSWPELLADELKGITEVTYDIQYGLNFARSIPIITNMHKVDTLILHFGIAVGWPVSYRKVDIKLGTTPLKNEYAYHQPNGRGRNFQRRIINRTKFRVRNFVKYGLFLTGQYKPRVAASDLEDQIAAVLSVAKTKATNIIWIQHVPAWSMRTFVERWYYKKYISRVETICKRILDKHFLFISPDQELADVSNYALDTTHLSAKGHIAYANFFSKIDLLKES